MAVYERSYRGYHGPHTSARWRFWVIPRYAYQQVLGSRGFVAFLVLCFIYPVASAVIIYLPHNLRFLELFGLTPADLSRFVEEFIFPRRFMYNQGFMSFLLVFAVGPALISADLRNNALPLYLSRPLTRSEYVLGKLTVLAVLLSAITWIPGLVLFVFESYLMGWSWFLGHLRVIPALVMGFWTWILLLSLFSLAISAYVKWKTVARLALVVLFFLGAAFGGLVNFMFDTEWGRLLNLSDMIHVVWSRLLGEESAVEFPLWGAWLSVLGVCAACLGLLARKVRAYEVVR